LNIEEHHIYSISISLYKRQLRHIRLETMENNLCEVLKLCYEELLTVLKD